MHDYIKKLLKTLCGIMSVSGFEDTFEDRITDVVLPYFDEYTKTPTGSFLFKKNSGKQNAPVILIDTHFDEIGFMVTGIHENGFLSFSPLGGIDTRILSGADVTVYGKVEIPGVITSRAPHLMTAAEAKENPDIKKLFIDTGCSEAYLKDNSVIGACAVFSYPVTELLNNRIAGHGLDNKACIAAALTAMKLLEGERLNADLVLMLSSREELGGMGAYTGANHTVEKLMLERGLFAGKNTAVQTSSNVNIHGGVIHTPENLPYASIVLDVNLAFLPENPGADTEMFRQTVEVGEGTSISMSAVTNRKLTKKLIETAENADIPHQTIVEASTTGTNADRLALAGLGIPTAVVSVPLQNMHTYSEIVCTDDILSTSKLISQFVRQVVSE